MTHEPLGRQDRQRHLIDGMPFFLLSLSVLGMLMVRMIFFPFWKRRAASPQPNTPRVNAPLVSLLTAANQAEADIVVGLLKTHAIPSLARMGGSGLAYTMAALQPYDILVLEPDFARAHEVLAAYRDAPEDTTVD